MFRRFCRFFLVAAALVAAPLAQAQLVIPGGGGGASVGGSSGQLQFNNAGVLGGGAGTAWDDTNRTLTISGATVTSSKPMLDLSQTWNAGAVAFSALKLNVTDTASANGSLLLDLQVGGVSKFNISKIGSLAAAGSISAYSSGLWSVSDSGGIFLGASSDVVLKRDAANQLGQRNGANAQTFNVYNTYTDALNYERASFYWSGNLFYISTAAAGTGTARSLVLTSAGTTYIGSSGGNQWFVNSSTGHWLANVDNTYDIGASGANRPRNVHVAGYVLSGSAIASGASAGIGWNGRSQMYSTADGTVVLENAAGTSFSLLQLGGTTSSFPAIKRNGAAINFRLADDTGDAAVTASGFTSTTAGLGLGMAAGGEVFWNGRGQIFSPADGQLKLSNWAATAGAILDFATDATVKFRNTANSADAAITAASISTSSTTLHTTTVALTNGAAAATGTLTNAPVAGNPTKWFPINDNGTTRYVPAW